MFLWFSYGFPRGRPKKTPTSCFSCWVSIYRQVFRGDFVGFRISWVWAASGSSFYMQRTSGFVWPICSMYGICTNICPVNHPNVGKYTIHGAYGWVIMGVFLDLYGFTRIYLVFGCTYGFTYGFSRIYIINIYIWFYMDLAVDV